MSSESISHLQTPLQRLYHWEANNPNGNFLNQPISGEWHSWTWKEAATEIRKMAAAIEAQGFEPGSRIAILSRNCAQWMMSDIAIMMSGHISVPIYPNIKKEIVSYIIEHSEVKMMFTGKLESHDWVEMRQGIPAGLLCVKYGMYGLDAPDFPTWESFSSGHEPKADSPTRDVEDIMTIIYTSGTTGTPKGVVQKFLAPVFAFETFNSIFNLTASDRFFSYLPLSHIAERMLITMGALRSGGSVHFAQSLDTFADNLKTCSPTVFLGVPRIWTKFQMGVLAKFSPSKLNLLLAIPIINNIIRKKIKEALGLSQARICLTGAAPIPVSTLEWYDKIGLDILEVYGMTENAAYSHSNLPGQQKYGTVGKTMPGVEMKITDEGEICVKSLANMVEYYREPEKTAATIREGFLHTGDKGVVDSEGYVRITGRVKDIFKTSKAKYVAPSPIEMKFSKNELVEQICVVGTGIPQPIALIVLSEAARSQDKGEVEASIEATLKEVNPLLDHHERLQKAVIVSEEWTTENNVLTPSLKIKRGTVDEKYMPNYEKWYDGGVGVVWE